MKEQTLRLPGNSVLKRGLLFGIILLAHAPSTAHGQQLVAGGTIRVRPSQSPEPEGQWTVEPESRWTEATVVRLTPDSLWYESGRDVAALSVDNVEVRRPTLKDQRWLGMGLGGALGGVIGAFVGAAMAPGPRSGPGYVLLSPCPPWTFGCDLPLEPFYFKTDSSTDDIVGAAAVGTLVGGGLGYLAGKMLRRWETVELAQVTVGNGRLGLSMSVRP